MKKQAFEQAIDTRGGIPSVDAAAFFLSIKHFPATNVASMSKTAGWQDPPDEEGVLEGQFEVPVENAVALMGAAASKLMEVMNASMIYANSVRGLYAREVRCALNDWDHRSTLEYLIQRMSVLAGPPHLKEPEVPPASTQPVEIAKRMIRAEQELIHVLRELKTVLGDNPSKDRIGSAMLSCQSHIDELWKALPPELCGPKPMMPGQPNQIAAHEAVEAPAQEAAETPEFEAAEQAAGVEPPDHGAAKTASAKHAFFTGPAALIGRSMGRSKAEQALVGQPMSYADFDKARTSAGRKAFLGTGAGWRGGAVLGGTGGLALGTALGLDPVLSGMAGAGLGAGLGGYTGYRVATRGLDKPKEKSEAKEAAAKAPLLPEELDAAVADQALKGRLAAVQGASRAESMARHQRGERVGDVLGRLAGTAGGALLGKKLLGGGAQGTLGGAGIGYLLGGKVGKEVGTEVDTYRKKSASVLSKLAHRMAKRVKLAEELGMGDPGEASMATPTDSPELQPTNYLAAEQLGQQAQHAQELAFFKNKAQKAMQQAMSAMQQSQGQMEQMQTQMAELQQQADSAKQNIEQALGEAMQARNEALSQTQVAANMRMGMQKLRQQMVEIASQDPAAVAAQELDNVANQSKQQAAEQAAMEQQQASMDAGMMDPAAAAGPAAQAPAPQTAPGAAPAAGSPDMNANAGGPPGPGGEMSRETQGGIKESSAKLAGWLGAGAGAIYGGGKSLYDAAKLIEANPQALRDKVQVLEQTQDGSYGRAAELAKAKKTLADAELAGQHPGGFGLRASAKGAVLGALRGNLLEQAVNQGVNVSQALNQQRNVEKLTR